ncbi:MAG: hypothetical protein HYU59_14095 [Magnetospirillum gryphiswaldense]|nr:hypothetical protein [Magnetospirillum gryphiswaldense]
MAAEPDLQAMLTAAKNVDVDAAPVGHMTLVDATSKYLKRIEGDIDFPFQIGLDMAIDATPRPLGEALTALAAETGRYVVIFDVTLAKVTRRVRDMKDKVSQKVTSLDKIDNPAFQRAMREYDQAAVRMERRPSDSRLVQRLETARQKLTTTPQFLEKATYGTYSYKVADVEGTKALTVTYYLLDRETRRYLKSAFDVVERERFVLAYDRDPTDPVPASDASTEEQVGRWERAPVMIDLSKLLEHAVAQGPPNVHDGNLMALLDDVARERNRSISRADAERYDERPLNDARFDSVVAVYTPGGGMAAGAALGTLADYFTRDSIYVVITEATFAVRRNASKARRVVTFDGSPRIEEWEESGYGSFHSVDRVLIANYGGGRNVAQSDIADDIRNRQIRSLISLI